MNKFLSIISKPIVVTFIVLVADQWLKIWVKTNMVIHSKIYVFGTWFKLHFVENPGKILSRADLLMKMTGRELKPHDRTVDVTIRRIRKHFESLPDTPEIIATIHGEGYRFCGNLEEA